MSVNKPVRPSHERANLFNKNEYRKLLTDPVFLIGNGASRKDFDLNRLHQYGTIVGCNALYRDFLPDILLAIDAKMLREILKAKIAEEIPIIIPPNRSVAIPNAHKWKAPKFNTTGCYAMYMISMLMKPKYCYMFGMDNYPGNLYDGTENYSINSLQNFEGVGKYYLGALQGRGDTKFINVNHKDTWPKEAEKTGNYMHITYEQFEEIINYGTMAK